MNVKKYKAKQHFTIDNTLILTDDIIYMEQTNPVGGFYRPKLFNERREVIGHIAKDDFYDVEKKLEPVE
jgi:hypothetical protein